MAEGRGYGKHRSLGGNDDNMGQEPLKTPVLAGNLSVCRPGGGMADTEDSKSSALTGVRVQLPLRAQSSKLILVTWSLKDWFQGLLIGGGPLLIPTI